LNAFAFCLSQVSLPPLPSIGQGNGKAAPDVLSRRINFASAASDAKPPQRAICLKDGQRLPWEVLENQGDRCKTSFEALTATLSA